MDTHYITEAATFQMPMVCHAAEVGWASFPHSHQVEESR